MRADVHQARGDRQQGFALPMALIVLATLTILSLGLSRMARAHMEHAMQVKVELQDELVAYNTFQKLLFTMFSGRIEAFTLHAGKYVIPVNGSWVRFEGVWIKVQDRRGLYPLQADEWVLKKILLAYVGKARAEILSARVADWIDIDSLPRIGGMERADYVASGLSSMPRNGPMRTLEELLEIPGITPLMMQGNTQTGKLGLRDLLVLQRETGFNVATSPEALLGPVLGLDQQRLAQVLQARKQQDWRQVREIIGSEKFGEELVLSAGRDYTIVIRMPSGRKVRIGLRLTRAASHPYELLSWRYPDYEWR